MVNKTEKHDGEILLNSQIRIENTIEPMKQMLSSFIKIMDDIQPTIYKTVEGVFNTTKKFAEILEEIKNDPDSVLSYMSYKNDLLKYYWVIPFNIDTVDLKKILNKVQKEKEFDDCLIEFYNNNRIQELIDIIKNNIPIEYKTIFKQIEDSFWNKHYALINLAIISLIDNELSYFIEDKRKTKRIGLLEPIIKDISKNSEYTYYAIILTMINNNINILFDNVDFNNIKFETNKEISRHAVQHGKMFTNKKISSIMLLNTFLHIIVIKKELKKYKDKLKFDDKIKKYYII